MKCPICKMAELERTSEESVHYEHPYSLVCPMDRERLHVVKIGPILYLDVRAEPLRRMTDDLEYGRAECIREGFPQLTPAEFVAMYCKANKCTPEKIVHRVELKHLYEPHPRIKGAA